MAPSSTPTAGSGSAVESHYVEAGAEFEASVIITGYQGIAGLTDPMLVEPIDYEAELATRAHTHAPLDAVEGDLANDVFGI